MRPRVSRPSPSLPQSLKSPRRNISGCQLGGQIPFQKRNNYIKT